MRIALVLLLVVHGLIHALGVASSWKLATVPQLSGRATFALPDAIAGALWLIAGVALLGAAVMVGLRSGSWWLVAAIGAVTSQVMIVQAWHDARFGTVANLLLVLPIAIGLGRARFDAATDRAVAALYRAAPAAAGDVITANELAPLPPPVQRWLTAAGVVGAPRVRAVRLRQRGQMRTAPDGAWMDATAEQYFTVEPPGFVWAVDVTMARVLPVIGRDTYAGGHGRMLILAGGLVPVVDSRGDEIDQGSALRFLGELVWFPSAALAPYLRWEPLDARRAKVTMTDGGREVSAELTFDDAGHVTELTALRYFGGGDDARLERWVIPMRGWQRRDRFEIPTEGEVTWRLPAGDFTYYRWQLDEVEYDQPARFAAR